MEYHNRERERDDIGLIVALLDCSYYHPVDMINICMNY